MRNSRVPGALVAIIVAALFAVGCGVSDDADAGAECKKAAENIPAGQVRDQAIAACDNAEGESVQDVKNTARTECEKAAAQLPPARSARRPRRRAS